MMGKAAIVDEIAEFTNFTNAVVFKESDYNAMAAWIKTLPELLRDTLPAFDMLPIDVSKDED